MRVGIGCMPACIADIVVEFVVQIPTEDDVAKAEALIERRAQLVRCHELTAENSVHVKHADLRDRWRPGCHDVHDANCGRRH